MQLTDGHVLTCMVQECSYNQSERCCAPRIMVGDTHPMCDMFTTAVVEVANTEPRVESCGVEACHFNKRAECHAAGITVMQHSEHADCGTYRM